MASSFPKEFKVCYATNIVWIFISALVLIGSLSHPAKDKLFILRYTVAFISSFTSAIAISGKPSRFLGRLSVGVFAPFVLIQVVEIWIVHKCGPGVGSYWGVACSSLLTYPDDSRFLQVAVDELAEFLFGVANMYLLWDCHIKKGHLLYDARRFRAALRRPFLSAAEGEASGNIQEYVSAEEGDFSASVVKVYNFFALSIFFIILVWKHGAG